MHTALMSSQIISGILMIAAILLQQRGSGLGDAFGGGGHLYAVRRGAEKALFTATIMLAVIFFSSGIGLTLISP